MTVSFGPKPLDGTVWMPWKAQPRNAGLWQHVALHGWATVFGMTTFADVVGFLDWKQSKSVDRVACPRYISITPASRMLMEESVGFAAMGNVASMQE